jgi:FMN reductase (NADPH)
MEENATPGKKTETIRLLEDRVSVRKFRSDPVSPEMLEWILSAACRAPTSSNLQAYSLVVANDPATRAALAELAGDQKHVVSAPVFIAVCADLSKVEDACARHGLVFRGDTLEIAMVSVIDASLVGMCASLAAESLGLGSVMIGGMRNNPVEAARLLSLPPRSFVAFGLCLGWPADRPPQKPRLPLEAVVHHEVHDATAATAAIGAYDSLLHQHYSAQSRPTDAASWSRRTAEEFSRPRREHLRRALETLGIPAK